MTASSRLSQVRATAERVSTRAFTWSAVTAVLSRTTRARGRGLALLWHRIIPEGARPHDVVPTVSVDRFRAQLEAIGDVGDLVPLGALEHEVAGGRPRFAITFDDDHPSHVRHALPVLRELGVPATFFLSGRWTHGLGPYWWEALEERMRVEGVARTSRFLDVDGAGAPSELAAVVEGRPELQERLVRADPRRSPPMARGDAVTLLEAGMEIGFHTLRHPVLTAVPGDALAREVGDGLADLERDLGIGVSRFAYPHGRTDHRVTAAVAACGFRTAWTTSHLPAEPHGDPHRQGRWEPGPRPVDALVRGLLRRLNLPRRSEGQSR